MHVDPLNFRVRRRPRITTFGTRISGKLNLRLFCFKLSQIAIIDCGVGIFTRNFSTDPQNVQLCRVMDDLALVERRELKHD
jgi:hypothetical protein